MSSRMSLLDAHLEVIDTLLSVNPTIVDDAEHNLRGSAAMTALHQARRTETDRRKARADQRANR